MTDSMRRIAVVVLLAAVWLTTPGFAADVDALMQELRVAPAGLKPAPAFSLRTSRGKRWRSRITAGDRYCSTSGRPGDRTVRGSYPRQSSSCIRSHHSGA